jgi:diaminopimelate decarboxylase
MKKALTVGVGALFLTEEGVRSLMGDVKLPKELIGGILESANKTKTEFLQNLSRDVREKVVDKIDPLALLQEFLSRNEVEFTVRVNVKPKKKPE